MIFATLSGPYTSASMSSFTLVLILEPSSQNATESLRDYVCNETLKKVSQADCLQTWWGTSYKIPCQIHLFIGEFKSPFSDRKHLPSFYFHLTKGP